MSRRSALRMRHVEEIVVLNHVYAQGRSDKKPWRLHIEQGNNPGQAGMMETKAGLAD